MRRGELAKLKDLNERVANFASFEDFAYQPNEPKKNEVTEKEKDPDIPMGKTESKPGKPDKVAAFVDRYVEVTKVMADCISFRDMLQRYRQCEPEDGSNDTALLHQLIGRGMTPSLHDSFICARWKNAAPWSSIFDANECPAPVRPIRPAPQPPHLHPPHQQPPRPPPAEPSPKRRKQAIPKHVKTLVWNQYVGSHINEHRCLCCKKTLISIVNFHAGHVQSEAYGGTHELSNLRPICAACNHSMGAMNMIDFVVQYGLFIG
jgi:hypothetical protein